MNTPLNLKDLERKAYRSTYQDGLWDIYQGGLTASFTAFVSVMDPSINLSTLQRFLLFMVGVGFSYLIFWGGKKWVTLPRIGQVKFGPARQRRKRTLAVVLGSIVVIQAFIVALTVALWQNPALSRSLGLAGLPQNLETLLVAVLAVCFVGPSLSLRAYFNDFPRGYYIAAVVSTSVFCLVWFGSAVYTMVGGLLIILPGIVLFLRFLAEHPLPASEGTNG